MAYVINRIVGVHASTYEKALKLAMAGFDENNAFDISEETEESIDLDGGTLASAAYFHRHYRTRIEEKESGYNVVFYACYEILMDGSVYWDAPAISSLYDNKQASVIADCLSFANSVLDPWEIETDEFLKASAFDHLSGLKAFFSDEENIDIYGKEVISKAKQLYKVGKQTLDLWMLPAVR